MPNIPHTKYAVVIPAYNEEQVLGEVIRSLKAMVPTPPEFILVVNDGSSDRTKEIAQANGAVVVSHLVNCGYGAAIKTGFDWCLQNANDVDFIVTLDADGQHLAEDVSAVLKSDADYVIGRRVFADGSPFFKSLANRLADVLVFMLGGVFVHDTFSGLRKIRYSKLQLFKLQLQDYSACAELVLQAVRGKLQIAYAEIPARYSAYSMGKVKRLRYSNVFAMVKKLMA